MKQRAVRAFDCCSGVWSCGERTPHVYKSLFRRQVLNLKAMFLNQMFLDEAR